MAIQISEEAKNRYVERRRSELVKCLAAIDTKDFKFLQGIGHQLKGSAVTFGHSKLSELGEKLENQCLKKDLTAIREIVGQMEKYINSL